MKKVMKKLWLGLVVAVSLALVGCASPPPQQPSQAYLQKTTQTGVRITESDIGVPQVASVEYIRVKAEKSIFLDPPEDNTEVYLRVGDNSGRDWSGISMRQLVIQELRKRGFTVVSNAKNAAYALQVNILLADETSAAEIAQLDETKYGQDVSGIVQSVLLGATIGGIGASGGGDDATLAGAVGGGIIGGSLKALSDARKRKLLLAQQQTKFFSIIMDVEVRERARGTVTRSGSTNITNSQDSGSVDSVAGVALSDSQTIESTETEEYTEQSTWKRHRTRMVGKAKGKLVVFEDVEQDFAVKMVRAIAGFF